MTVKPGGLLEKVIKIAASEAAARICETCGNLIQVGENALGCTAHDKLILPDYPPFHGNAKCKDWKDTGKEATHDRSLCTRTFAGGEGIDETNGKGEGHEQNRRD